MIRAGDLKHGFVDTSEIKLIDPAIDSSYSRSKLRGDELLISCVGSIGEVAMVTPDLKGWNIARAVARAPLDHGLVTREYVAAFLRSSFVQRYFTNELRTVSQPTLNIKQIKETPIRRAPLVEQTEFSARVDKVAAAISMASLHVAHLDDLFTSLLAVFCG